MTGALIRPDCWRHSARWGFTQAHRAVQACISSAAQLGTSLPLGRRPPRDFLPTTRFLAETRRTVHQAWSQAARYAHASHFLFRGRITEQGGTRSLKFHRILQTAPQILDTRDSTGPGHGLLCARRPHAILHRHRRRRISTSSVQAGITRAGDFLPVAATQWAAHRSIAGDRRPLDRMGDPPLGTGRSFKRYSWRLPSPG